MNDKRPAGGLNKWMATALVLGNMIGSGIFLLPSALGQYGGLSLIGWIISALGALTLAKVFSYLSKRWPLTGGPYVYTRQGLGDFAGFWVAWGYWISIWCTNAAITVALISYLTVFVPILDEEPIWAVITGLSVVWGVTWVNLRGIRSAGYLQLVTTVLKVMPLLAVSLFGLLMINWDHFTPFNSSGESAMAGIVSTTTLTLFAFLGIESATIPAEDVEAGEKTVSSATWIGTISAVIIYILSTVAVMGVLTPAELTASSAPFADAAVVIWGPAAGKWVALGAVISTFGALNGWILMQGQIPLAAASDKLFPGIFKVMNKHGVPGPGLIISSVLISVLMMANYTKGLTKAFEYMILLSTLTVLVPYLFSSAVYIQELLKERQRPWRQGAFWVGVAAFAFSFYAVIGSGADVVFLGFLMLCLGIPVYVFIRYKAGEG